LLLRLRSFGFIRLRHSSRRGPTTHADECGGTAFRPSLLVMPPQFFTTHNVTTAQQVPPRAAQLPHRLPSSPPYTPTHCPSRRRLLKKTACGGGLFFWPRRRLSGGGLRQTLSGVHGGARDGFFDFSKLSCSRCWLCCAEEGGCACSVCSKHQSINNKMTHHDHYSIMSVVFVAKFGALR
jgi:hypothetical protein